jgi:hypothetical protein
MVTINISIETKERFKKIKLDVSAKQNKRLSEEDLMKLLLDKFEEKI